MKELTAWGKETTRKQKLTNIFEGKQTNQKSEHPTQGLKSRNNFN